MMVLEATAYITTYDQEWQSEYVEGTAQPLVDLSGFLLHCHKELTGRMLYLKDQGLVNWALFLESRELNAFEECRAAFLRWCKCQKKRQPFDWHYEARASAMLERKES